MIGTIASQRKAKGYASTEELSRALVSQCADDFAEMDSRSLSAKIADLDKGRSVWWMKRPKKLKSLIEFLELEMDELSLGQRSGRYVIDFPMFPNLTPLDLRREDAYIIGDAILMKDGRRNEPGPYGSRPTLERWFQSSGHVSGGIEWLQVADGFEYRLLTQKLALIRSTEFILCDSLGEVIENDVERLRTPSPLVIVIRNDASVETLEILAHYRPDAPRLVVSPHSKPLAKFGNSSGSSGKPALLEIRDWVWTLRPDWRQSLLHWIEHRLESKNVDRLFTKEAAWNLLNKYDRNHQWFATVEDVLILCGAIDNAKEIPLGKALRSAVTGSHLLELLLGRQESRLSLVQQLVKARWGRWDLALTGGIAADAWRDLSEGFYGFDALLDWGIVSSSARGYDFKNPIVARWLLREHLFELFRNGNLSSWAPACFDVQRRQILDAALDVAPVNVLEALWERIVESGQSAGRVGASEAIFVAIGRRIINGEDVSERLHPVARCVLDRIRDVRNYAWPLSRPVDSLELQLDWLSVCWAWSLLPVSDTGDTFPWQFPGWQTSVLEELDAHLEHLGRYSYGGSSHSWAVLADPMQRFLTVIWHWMEKQNIKVIHKDRPAVFNAALLARADKSGVNVDESWWIGVLGDPAAEQALLSLVSAERLSLQSLAEAWWPSIVRHICLFAGVKQEHLFSSMFRQNVEDAKQSVVFKCVMEQLEPKVGDALHKLSESDLEFLTNHPELLSTTFKRTLFVLVTCRENFDIPSWAVFGFLSSFGSDTATELEALLDHSTLGRAAAQNLWDWRKEDAEILIRRPGSLSPEARRNLVLASPPAALGAAIARLKVEPDLLRSDKENWARSHLPDSGIHASELLQFLELS